MPTIDPEHDGRGEGWEGEDTVEYMGVDDTWDADREGARLILSYDVTAGAFTGEIGNTGRSMLCAVRVAVVLEGGTELGPTSGTSLTPGQSSSIRIPAGGRPVEAWTARPQVSSC